VSRWPTRAPWIVPLAWLLLLGLLNILLFQLTREMVFSACESALPAARTRPVPAGAGLHARNRQALAEILDRVLVSGFCRTWWRSGLSACRGPVSRPALAESLANHELVTENMRA